MKNRLPGKVSTPYGSRYNKPQLEYQAYNAGVFASIGESKHSGNDAVVKEQANFLND